MKTRQRLSILECMAAGFSFVAQTQECYGDDCLKGLACRVPCDSLSPILRSYTGLGTPHRRYGTIDESSTMLGIAQLANASASANVPVE